MKQTYEKIRPACDFAGVLSDEAALAVVNGRMEAFNKNLTASVPIADLEDFAVPAVDLDFAMRKTEEIKKLSVTKQNLVLNGKTRVRRLADRGPLKRPDIETTPIPDKDDLLDALEDVFPFTMGDKARAWSEGARFDGNLITATNSVVLLQAELASDCGVEGVTISRSTLSYMRQRREELEAWGISDRGIMLEFSDGSWALGARMAMEMPDAAVNLVNQGSYDDLPELDVNTRGNILATIEWSDDVVSIYSDKVYAGRWSTDHNEVVDIDLGDQEGPALFGAKALQAVMLRASRIGFDRFPQAVPFTTTRGSKGLIAGRTK